MIDVTALGELLIDFTPRQKSERGNLTFEANPGGAPANVLAALSKLGKKTAFIGKVGSDTFGQLLKKTLQDAGIQTDGLSMSDQFFTTLAFVTLDSDGNRSFAFSRNNSADVMLEESEVDENLIRRSKIFHCGTLSLTHPSCRQATVKALETAKKNGVLISVDPNLRMPLWESEEMARSAIRLALSYADIIKISDYELEFLYGESDVKKGAELLFAEYHPKILFATCGKDGAYLVKEQLVLHHPCFHSVKTVDTTGAGDTFCGAALSKLLEYDLNFSEMDEQKCYDLLRYASAAASLVTASYGAICVMPEEKDIFMLERTEKML